MVATRHGLTWTGKEDLKLLDLFRNKHTLSFMAAKLRRSTYAVECRLRFLGRTPR